MLTKNLLDPRHTQGPMDTMRVGDTIGIYAPQPRSTGCIAEVFEEADATLFAAAPDLAKAVREYLEGLEGIRDGLARRVATADYDSGVSEVAVRVGLETARCALSAAAPLYDLLAKVYGMKEDSDV